MSFAPRPARIPSPVRDRDQRRADIGDHLLDALEALVRRHRALRSADTAGLQSELITAEVAHELAIARSALDRTPPVGVPLAPVPRSA